MNPIYFSTLLRLTLRTSSYIFLAFIFFSCSKQQETTENIHFFIISDWGYNGASDQMKVARQIEAVAAKARPDFILTCGDNFQYSGVQSADDSLWKINYEQVYDVSSLKIPWYPVLGNHDYYGNADAEIEYSHKNQYWRMPSRYYSFVTSPFRKVTIRFIMLDTPDLVNRYNNLADTNNTDSIPQIRWMKDILAGSKQDWIFVLGHYPVFSGGIAHGDTKELISLLNPVFESNHVDFYICGHDHDFEHARSAGKNTEYIVTGTGGSIRPVTGNSRTVFCLSSLGFTDISVSKGTATVRFITCEGDTAYSFTKINPEYEKDY